MSPSQKIKLYPDNPIHRCPHITINTLYYVTLSHRRILGVTRTQWPLLHELFHTQSQQLAQLQTANNTLEDHAIEAQTDILDAAAKVTSTVVQEILMNMLTGSHSPRGTRAAKPESFYGSRDKAEQFVQSICIAVTMQLNMFAAKRMKILYALSFMHGGIAQV